MVAILISAWRLVKGCSWLLSSFFLLSNKAIAYTLTTSLRNSWAEGKCDRMEGSVAKNFVEGKSNEQVIDVGHHARKAAPILAV